MKKLIGTVAALLLVAGAAFAEITFGAWLRVLEAPIASDGDETIYAGMTNSWGYGARPARLNVTATSEDGKAGMSMGIYNDVGGIGAGDDCVMWVKPLDMLRVSFGVWDYGAVRGDLAYGSWNWLRPKNAVAWGEGLTFPQLGNQCGILLELTPIDNLLVIWNLPYAKMAATNKFDGTYEAYEAFEKQHIAAKYTIENIGTVKLGWQGKGAREYVGRQGGKLTGYKTTKDLGEGTGKVAKGSDVNLDDYALAVATGYDQSATDKKGNSVAFSASNYEAVYTGKVYGEEEKYLGNICAAFDLTAVENLYVTVGGWIAVCSSDYKKAKSSMQLGQVALGASYAVTDEFKVYGDFAMGIYNKSDYKIGPSMSFGLGLDYALMDNLTLSADFRGYIPSKADGEKVADPDFSFLVGADYGVSSNGSIGIAFQGYIRGKDAATPEAYDGGGSIYPVTPEKFSFAVPLKMQVSF